MNLSHVLLGGGLALIATGVFAIERLPIEEFARQADTSRATLSPDGRHLAFLRDVGPRTKLHVLEIDTGQMIRIDPGEAALANGARKEVTGVEWVGDERVIISTEVWDMFYGVLALDINGRRTQAISGYEDERITMGPNTRIFAREMIHRFDDADQTILMLDRHEVGPGARNRPDVLRIGTKDGMMSVELKNPGEVSGWGVDSRGQIRMGVLSRGDLSGVIYRESDKAPWRTILPLQNRTGEMRPVGFDGANEKIFVAALTEQKRWTIFPLDPATGKLGEALLADPEYDILPERSIPSIDGMPLCAPIFSRNRDKLLGTRFLTDAPRVKWFVREYAGYQQSVDKMRPDTVNFLVDISRDGKRMLWFSYSDQNPGEYQVLDLEKRSFKPIAARMGWIKPARMAQTLGIKYTARDGLVIHGYLTVPAGHQPKGLPLVVHPHGGPWVRDIWGYNPTVQLLANRGYAVLQMNYRGSPGYGQELFRSSRRQIGRKIQDDIEDGTRWAIAAGVADPQRIAIYGASYGGYSALFALGHNPELYRCGISSAGVTDWLEIFDDHKSDPDYRSSNRYWRREIGDPEKDQEFLRSISPVNFADKIVAPVLIVQGKKDRIVPQEQAKRMIAALEKSGRKPESLYVAGQGHGFTEPKARLESMQRIVAFLEKHLGPGVE